MTDSRAQPRGDASAEARRRMVHEQLQARGIRDPATLMALGRVPREAFVAAGQRHLAYADRALPIGHDQTISQPYMVALMTQALGLADLDWPWVGARPAFLDVGTGSGYQAAVLAQIGARVISIERDPHLAADAQARLASLGYDVEVLLGDGSVGLAERAPFAGIVVGAGAPAVPEPLVEQLTDGGRLVIPVGTRSTQRLTVVRRVGHDTRSWTSDPCVFVPLVGSHGHPV